MCSFHHIMVVCLEHQHLNGFKLDDEQFHSQKISRMLIHLQDLTFKVLGVCYISHICMICSFGKHLPYRSRMTISVHKAWYLFTFPCKNFKHDITLVCTVKASAKNSE